MKVVRGGLSLTLLGIGAGLSMFAVVFAWTAAMLALLVAAPAFGALALGARIGKLLGPDDADLHP